MPQRVVLAYSGGLDTSVAVKWIQEEWGAEVIALAVDVGQQADDPWDEITARALAAGAVEARVVDARAEFADEYLVPAIHANALYEGKYPLVSALSRPVIAKHLVDAARELRRRRRRARLHRQGQRPGALRGVGTRALAPDLEILAPVRVWGFTRDDSIDYAAKHGIPISVTKKSPYSIDENLWGRAIECGEHRGPVGVAAARRLCAHRRRRRRATETREMLVIGFEQGVPVALDGVVKPLHELVIDARRHRRRVRLGPASTWSRTAGSASRAARPTSARARWRCCSRTPTSSRSRSSATSSARRPASSRATPSWSTTVCGSRRSRKRSTPSCADAQRFVTGEVRLRLRAGPVRRGRTTGRPRPVQPRPRHLRRVRHVPPRGLRGLRAAVGPLGGDLGP